MRNHSGRVLSPRLSSWIHLYLKLQPACPQGFEIAPYFSGYFASFLTLVTKDSEGQTWANTPGIQWGAERENNPLRVPEQRRMLPDSELYTFHIELVLLVSMQERRFFPTLVPQSRRRGAFATGHFVLGRLPL